MWEVTTEDIAYFKALAKLKGDGHDDFIRVMAPLLCEHIAEYVEKATRGNETLSPPMSGLKASYKLFIAKALEHNVTTQQGLASRKMDDVSYSYELEFPKSLYTQYLPRKKVRFL